MNIIDKRTRQDGVPLQDLKPGQAFKLDSPSDERTFIKILTENRPVGFSGSITPIVNLYSGLLEWADPSLPVFLVDAHIVLVDRRS